MAQVKVTPVIGTMSKDRIGSLSGCHALHERTVARFCGSEDVGEMITDAIQEILMFEARQRGKARVEELKYIVEFKL